MSGSAATGTGRLEQGLGARTRRVVYGEPGPAAVRGELEATSTVDLAHVVMLRENGLLPGPAAAALLDRIRRLRADGFAELTGRQAPRGLYLMYEGHLVEELGPDVGGKVHTARSRNDIKATVTAMRLRAELTDLLGELLRLQAALLSRARRHDDAVMPVYTHFQPAMPIGYGYYLAGIATALDRDLDALRHTLGALDRCPLGAGAVAGTDLPIDPARTAGLLGFGGPTLHATDAVAARDTLLRALGTVASAAVTLSRLATDLQLWSTQEFGFVEFPERLVGGSSAMPQKRNAFLLEHVKAKAAWAMGAWTASAAAAKSTPFTNSIEVGTEAVAVAWPALAAVRDSVLLCQVLVSGARPVPARMEQRAREGFTTATTIANRLVGAGVPFRTAHHVVGRAVRDALAAGERELTKIETPEGVTDLDGGLPSPAEAAAALNRGGGPGETAAVVTALRDRLAGHGDWITAHREGLREAARRLDAAVEAVVARYGTGDAR
ncbi:argininosuccinate lyase [Streptomyces subrutilus]|uniref:Argininosuccinate lyase n=1 Tax=Streptomyces subrutilus TaxID=36818 RepID=A0A5P2UKC5_9ACTN|nr:argininosuccinate lyase [Streptomyces subrutilus]QEU79766.1 argininosuccinate lyase [Streptomyces subrutilus]WSJ30978.1 argininosuccinate lyase [Streptomyces subrutilus]GGZ68177.1 argininosuccinate lyase [Streptomyces subrutilus]